MRANSIILWEGPSAYDGAPIVAIATGLASKSANRKTGDMAQVWILRADIAPLEAVKSGQDASICGKCPLRPSTVKIAKLEGENARAQCYVQVAYAPNAIYKAYQRGSYAHATYAEAREAFATHGNVRLGAYGDPAAVPFEVWHALGFGANEFKHTGYTHGWLTEGFDPRHLQILMASIDPISAWDVDKLPGYRDGSTRTFRVLGPESSANDGEIECPNTTRGIACADCGLCAGSLKQAKSIVIHAHGGATPNAAK